MDSNYNTPGTADGRTNTSSVTSIPKDNNEPIFNQSTDSNFNEVLPQGDSSTYITERTNSQILNEFDQDVLESMYPINSLSSWEGSLDFNTVSPNPDDFGWANWSPGTEDYWTLQYSDSMNKLKSGGKLGRIFAKKKRLSGSDMRMNIPQDADHFPTRMNDSSHGRDRNNDGNTSPDPPQDRHYFIPFANCNSRPHHLAPGFQHPSFRSEFFAKIFFVKSIQMFAILCVIFTYPFLSPDPDFDFIRKKPNGSGYFALLIFMVMFCCARCFASGRTTIGGVLTLVICSLCSAVVCMTIFYNGEPYVVSVILMSLLTSYASLAAISYFTKMDVSEKGNIFCVACGTVLASIMISFSIVFVVSDPFGGLPNSMSKGAKFTGMFTPSFLTTLTLILFQISEVHQVMGGYRLPLREDDYIVAAAFLL